ncbi:MAG: hypothetical protein OXT68_00795 [Chloroflexota bacterium]|nr:hypothetical protein [Chloroflexota bacterium]
MNPRTIVDDLQDLRPDISDDLSRNVEAALTNEGLLAPDYTEPSEFVRNNFAESGLDEESDQRAEAHVRNHVARAEELELLEQAYGDVQHLALLGQLPGRAFFDTSAEISRLAQRGVINGRMPYKSVFGPQDLTEDEFNFGRGALDGTYFSDLANISGRGRLITAPVLASGPGGAGDSGDEGDVEYTYADVKDLVEVDLETAASKNDAAHYDDMLESVLGFELILNDANDDQEDIRQIRNLAKAATLIVDYFAEVYFKGDEDKALRAFQLLVDEVAHTQEHRHRYLNTVQHWHGHWHGHWHEIEGGALSHGHGHEHEELTIYLEDDRAGGDDLGRVPLPYIRDGVVTNESILNDMYLGSLPTTVDDFEVGYSIGTILHEFGHVIDRRMGFTAALNEPVPEAGGISRQYSLGGMHGLNVNKQIPERGVQGFGAKQAVYNELGIAPFVTDVVEVSGETLHMLSILPDPRGRFDTFGSDFYNCLERGGCGPREIDWQRASDEANAEMTNNAIALRDAFREVFGGFLHQLIEDDMHE